MSIVIWVIASLVIAFGASGRGRSCFGWFLLSCLISPLLALVLLLLLPVKNKAQQVIIIGPCGSAEHYQWLNTKGWPCPACAALRDHKQ